MQSSAVVTLRAMVMLLCLVLVPLAAIFGSGLPKMLNSLVQGAGFPRFARAGREADEVRARGGDAPIFAAAPIGGSAADPALLAGHADSTGSLWAPRAVPRVGPAGAPSGDVHQPPVTQQSAVGMNPASTVLEDAKPQLSSPLPAYVDSANAAPAANPGFEQIEHRLRDLGATYYLLETWGTTNQQYRFHCKISVAGVPDNTRSFDAADQDPIRAMRRVLEQVEQFRSETSP